MILDSKLSVYPSIKSVRTSRREKKSREREREREKERERARGREGEEKIHSLQFTALLRSAIYLLSWDARGKKEKN